MFDKLPSNGAAGSAVSAPEISKNYATAQAPTLVGPSLKGGAAIRSVGEKFQANPVTGSCTASIPIPTTQSRGGFSPSLSLTYDSGSGNGVFGLGWSLSLPSIQRKTSKGIPRYNDEVDSDIFIVSGAADLTPRLKKPSTEGLAWIPDKEIRDGYDIHRYIPRVEGEFTLYERWTNTIDKSDCYWRAINKDNVTYVYGRTANSRIADPEAPDSEPRIFSWMLNQQFDDRGNAVEFTYQEENSAGVSDLAVSEAHRTAKARSAARYIQSIKYGNKVPLLDDSGIPIQLKDSDWLFEVVFDYGDFADKTPTSSKPTSSWTRRADPFSTYRSSFEIRTYRLCRRILLFHHIRDQLGIDDYLVNSLDFTYDENPHVTRLTSATIYGHVLDPARTAGEVSYLTKALPTLSLKYSEVPRLASLEAKDVALENLVDLSLGGSVENTTWLDLNNEGLTGAFSGQGNSWIYKRNLSASNIRSDGNATPRFGPAKAVTFQPNTATSIGGGADSVTFTDLEGRGVLDMIAQYGDTRGIYERTAEGGWTEFRPFLSDANIGASQSNERLIDLTGDGTPDILISEGDDLMLWYPAQGTKGFSPCRHVETLNPAERSPRVVFDDGTETIYLADITGDGLTDIVRIRNTDVCYWPSMGFGRFGRQVIMDNAPTMDSDDQFSQRRVRLADLTGTGLVDLLYFPVDGGVNIFWNQAGNQFSDAEHLPSFPKIDDLSNIHLFDLLGNGTSCLVWETSLPDLKNRSMVYIDIVNGQKPNLLVSYDNGMGLESTFQYRPSTRYYLEDEEAGTPWITLLPFPVHCLSESIIYDHISQARHGSRYAYHHGFWDPVEKEFCGFGMVEQWDTEEFRATSTSDFSNLDASFRVPPVHTKTWFHTGSSAVLHDGSLKFMEEYYQPETATVGNFAGQLSGAMAQPITMPDLSGYEFNRQAQKALKGSQLHQEVYTDDGSSNAVVPYSIEHNNYEILMLQPIQDGPVHGVFALVPRETVHISLERNIDDYRLEQKFILQEDQYLNVTKAVSIAYGRNKSAEVDANTLDVETLARQQMTIITYTEADFTTPIILQNAHRGPLLVESRDYEISGLSQPENMLFRLDSFSSNDFSLLSALPLLAFDEIASSNSSKTGKRLLKSSRNIYLSNDATNPLPKGAVESLALPWESYSLAFDKTMLTDVYRVGDHGTGGPTGDVLANLSPRVSGYVDLDSDGRLWVPSGTTNFARSSGSQLLAARKSFYTPILFTDPFGGTSEVKYDPYFMFVLAISDALGNITSAKFDYRSGKPSLVIDPNGNQKAFVYDEIGATVGDADMGKATEMLGDSLHEFQPFLRQSLLEQFLASPTPEVASKILGDATSCDLYDYGAYQRSTGKTPSVGINIRREIHTKDSIPISDPRRKLQYEIAYFDGAGRPLQAKKYMSQGKWVASQWTLLNNKGQPVRTYEPFYDDTHEFRPFAKHGVSSTEFYDPIGRVVGHLFPDHTFTKTVRNPWTSIVYDRGDTIQTTNPQSDPDLGNYFQSLSDADYLPTWLSQIQISTDSKSKASTQQSLVYSNTPTMTHVNAQGHIIAVREDNGNGEAFLSRYYPDVEGHIRYVTDTLDRITVKHRYNYLGDVVYSSSIDSGDRWQIKDVMGRQIFSWDSRGIKVRIEYDVLGRLTRKHVTEKDGIEFTSSYLVYGEQMPNPEASNLRGKLYRSFDQSGLTTNKSYDFKGNMLLQETQFAVEYKNNIDWSSSVADNPQPFLESEVFELVQSYNAFNLITEKITADGYGKQFFYNSLGLAESMQTAVDGRSTSPTWIPRVSKADFNERQQVTSIVHGNGAVTQFSYDPLTYRIIRETTLDTRGGYVQDLNYTYDCIGNIVTVVDAAKVDIFFSGDIVRPQLNYTYDATSRLLTASGREHLGQISGPTPYTSTSHLIPSAAPTDPRAMVNYLESYSYDGVGNFLEMNHQNTGRNTNLSWKRSYSYADLSVFQKGKINNRVTTTSVGSNGSFDENYQYDEHGNIIKMTGFTLLEYDFADHLKASSKQIAGDGFTPEKTYYRYDEMGNRVRKITERQAGIGAKATRMKDTMYLVGCDLYRTFSGDGNKINLEKWTTKLQVDTRKIGLLETFTVKDSAVVPNPSVLTRYSIQDHLSSVTLELDDNAQPISAEEYSPYGSTTYSATRSEVTTSKAYRFSSKERDQETGLYYIGARYFLTYLGRWLTPDPLGYPDGFNSYGYVANNPIQMSDDSGLCGRNAQLKYLIFSAVAIVFAAAALYLANQDPVAPVQQAVGRNNYIPDPLFRKNRDGWSNTSRPGIRATLTSSNAALATKRSGSDRGPASTIEGENVKNPAPASPTKQPAELPSSNEHSSSSPSLEKTPGSELAPSQPSGDSGNGTNPESPKSNKKSSTFSKGNALFNLDLFLLGGAATVAIPMFVLSNVVAIFTFSNKKIPYLNEAIGDYHSTWTTGDGGTVARKNFNVVLPNSVPKRILFNGVKLFAQDIYQNFLRTATSMRSLVLRTGGVSFSVLLGAGAMGYGYYRLNKVITGKAQYKPLFVDKNEEKPSKS
ncbi:virulence plasmid 65kDa B protein-domain-containing protein [Tricladium varicosporioides]|nr:virulence plasmid 65kDa B protein-domain-containing protein [Hymenoscyphus varicosporioides]